MPQSGGSNDFFDLKDGDKAVIVLLDEPFVLDIHTLPDDTKQFGKMFPCGAKDRNACPVCEDDGTTYGPDEKKVKGKCYYSVFVQSVVRKNGQKETLNEAKVMSGGARLHDGFMACYNVQADFGGAMIGQPLIITRNGGDASTTYNVQPHPDQKLKIDTGDKVPDVEKIAMQWIDKEWMTMGYDALASAAAADPEKDPFESLPAGKKAA